MIKNLKYAYYSIFLVTLLVIVCFKERPDEYLHIIACDVGQGDAILFVYKNIQILTDGGPDNKVLSCLGRHVPFWDRDIELIILSHGDSDHSTGLIEVVKRYKIQSFLSSGIGVSTQTYQVLENEVRSRVKQVVNSYYVNKLGVSLMHLDIFYPNRQNSLMNNTSSKNMSLSGVDITDKTNDFSLVYKLSMGNFKALMTGDLPPEVFEKVFSHNSVGKVNYIKIPHHGSANGLTEDYLRTFEPMIAVISVGKSNPWGFPSSTVLKLLESYKVRILRTDITGDVEVITDGEKMWVED